jgi:DNA-binding XRE family transcriptional regulator
VASLECARRFGENLVRSRKRAGLSQEELGARANLHRTAIGLLERGARMPRVDTLIKLAAGLDIDPSDLLDGMVWKPGTTTEGRFIDTRVTGLVSSLVGSRSSVTVAAASLGAWRSGGASRRPTKGLRFRSRPKAISMPL